MDATAMTVVSRLITDARTRFGAANVEALAVQDELLDEAMAHVLTVGGEVTADSCIVDGVVLRELPEGETTPLAYLRDSEDPRPLVGT